MFDRDFDVEVQLLIGIANFYMMERFKLQTVNLQGLSEKFEVL